MIDKDLYDMMTMKQLLRNLSKHRVHLIDGKRVIYPVTKTQKNIYDAFGVSVPV
jgi:hypothetical protein